MNGERADALDGGCTCGQVRYRLLRRPMLVHCCHCRWCQRETGSAFVLNALIERDQLQVLQGRTGTVTVPTHSGRGQKIERCPHCQVALWSHYPGGGDAIAFVRVGTLDTPEALPPDTHIYTASRLPWVTIPEGVAAFAEFYDPRTQWSAQTRQRYRDGQARASGATPA